MAFSFISHCGNKNTERCWCVCARSRARPPSTYHGENNTSKITCSCVRERSIEMNVVGAVLRDAVVAAAVVYYVQRDVCCELSSTLHVCTNSHRLCYLWEFAILFYCCCLFASSNGRKKIRINCVRCVFRMCESVSLCSTVCAAPLHVRFIWSANNNNSSFFLFFLILRL